MAAGNDFYFRGPFLFGVDAIERDEIIQEIFHQIHYMTRRMSHTMTKDVSDRMFFEMYWKYGPRVTMQVGQDIFFHMIPQVSRVVRRIHAKMIRSARRQLRLIEEELGVGPAGLRNKSLEFLLKMRPMFHYGRPGFRMILRPYIVAQVVVFTRG